MKLEAYIQTEIRDKNGQLKHFEKKKANSLVRGFIDALYALMAGVNLASCKNVSGGSYTITPYVNDLVVTPAAGDASYGIWVGSGSQAVSITDYNLGSKISHGSGAGQLNYLTTTSTNPATLGSTHSFTISRGFTNLSGSPISVSEVGMIAFVTGSNQTLIERTLMSFSIANGATGIVTYTMQISV